MSQTQSIKTASGVEVLEPERTRRGVTYRPDIDIYETDDEIVLVADVPGASAEDVDLRFENGMLDLRVGVRERRAPDASYLFYEYGVGDFFRTFQVTEDVDPGRISAEITDGVLIVHLPKIEAAKPRRIEVKPGAGAAKGQAGGSAQ